VADVKIRNLPDWLVDWHKRRAEAAGVSLEEHLRQLLERERADRIRQLAAISQEHCDRIQRRTGILPDSTPLIREARMELEAKFDPRPRRKRSSQVASARSKSA